MSVNARVCIWDKFVGVLYAAYWNAQLFTTIYEKIRSVPNSDSDNRRLPRNCGHRIAEVI